MSTFPQPEPRDSESPRQDPFSNEDLRTIVADMEYSITVLEPRVRHFNRRLVDLFGPHPSSEDGSWVLLQEESDGTFRFAFEPIELRHVFRLESVFDLLRELVLDSDVPGAFGTRSSDDVGVRVLGDAAGLRELPSVHVRVQRRS